MLKNNILPKKARILSLLILIIFISYIFASKVLEVKSYAAQTTEGYSESKINKYPGYNDLIKNLKSKYPNWQFKILYTGLDWNQVIKNETTASHGRNLVQKTKTGSWVCGTCGDKSYDSGAWKCASETTVSYYMDPRNWLNEDYIFQFENLAYDPSTQKIEGVNQIISDVPWMKGNSITYTKTDGTTATINKSYSQLIMESAQAAKISPYHLASRIRQEQGLGQTASSTAKGTYSGYNGYYNYCNIGASGSSSTTVIVNALNFAKNKGWTDPEKAMKGAASYLATSYIGVGQSTPYLQKFDVDNSDGKLYYHQYMQNVSAAVTESVTVKKSYSSMGMLNNSFTFIIPVYENMPNERCASPDSASIVTQNVKITGTNVQVRNSPSLLGTVLTKVNTNDILLRIECASSTVSGYYFDKIVLPNGIKGYIARNYITQVADQTNANTSAIANTSVNLRNGPGTSNTTIVTTLISGQAVTIIETGKYNGLNGYNWVRVKLVNGTQGYIAEQYLTTTGNNQANYKVAAIKCEEGSKVRIRSSATTSSAIVTSLAKGTTITVMQENVASANGYTWDKIVTSDGLEGYVANNYLNKENNNANTQNTTNTAAIPNNTPVNEKKYILGDCNGDNSIDSGDLLVLKKHLIRSNVVVDATRLLAMDVNKDGNIDSGDLLLIKKHLLKQYTITN